MPPKSSAKHPTKSVDFYEEAKKVPTQYRVKLYAPPKGHPGAIHPYVVKTLFSLPDWNKLKPRTDLPVGGGPTYRYANIVNAQGRRGEKMLLLQLCQHGTQLEYIYFLVAWLYSRDDLQARHIKYSWPPDKNYIVSTHLDVVSIESVGDVCDGPNELDDIIFDEVLDRTVKPSTIRPLANKRYCRLARAVHAITKTSTSAAPAPTIASSKATHATDTDKQVDDEHGHTADNSEGGADETGDVAGGVSAASHDAAVTKATSTNRVSLSSSSLPKVPRRGMWDSRTKRFRPEAVPPDKRRNIYDFPSPEKRPSTGVPRKPRNGRSIAKGRKASKTRVEPPPLSYSPPPSSTVHESSQEAEAATPTSRRRPREESDASAARKRARLTAALTRKGTRGEEEGSKAVKVYGRPVVRPYSSLFSGDTG